MEMEWWRNYIIIIIIIYPGIPRGIGDVDDDVDGLYHTSERVDGDEQNGAGFDQGIVQP